ncbi:MAG: glycosyltransferase family 9 protein, partial [Gemmatimonadota bacterium]
KRICIVLLSGIGDVVHGLPIVNALKRDDPERHITWVVESPGAPLLRPHPAVDDVLTFDRKRGLPEVIPLVSFAANRRIPARDTPQIQDSFMEFLEYLGIPVEPVEWRILLSDEEKRAQREFFRALDDRPAVAIVPSSGREPKDPPIELLARVAAAATRDLDCRVILLGGPGKREQARARAVEKGSEAEVVWALGPDLRRLTYIIGGCDLIMAPDTGPLHIARALEIPVIGLYGHTDPSYHGPYGAFEELTIDRYNYDAAGKPTKQTAATAREGRMELITVGDVVEKLELALDRYIKPARSGKIRE